MGRFGKCKSLYGLFMFAISIKMGTLLFKISIIKLVQVLVVNLIQVLVVNLVQVLVVLLS